MLEIEFVGFMVSKDGVEPKKVQVDHIGPFIGGCWMSNNSSVVQCVCKCFLHFSLNVASLKDLIEGKGNFIRTANVLKAFRQFRQQCVMLLSS